MIRSPFGDKRRTNEESLWTFFEMEQESSFVDALKSPRKSSADRRLAQTENDLFLRPLIDTVLPQPKSQKAFYSTVKKPSATKRTNTRVKRGKKA